MALTKVPASMIAVDGGFTMRNRVINGCCRVTQRTAPSLTTSNQYGQVDRMIGGYVNGSAGTLAQLVGGNAAGMTFKRGLHFSGVTLASGYVVMRHRIESINVLDTSGQTVTVSFKLFHDFGSTTNFKIGLRKPSALDNFTTTSTIGTDGTVAVPSGTTTVVSATYTLGSTDADNGIEIVMYHDAVSVTTKNVVLGDIQYTLGSEVEQMERRSIGTELALCQRYTYVINAANNTNTYQRFGVGECEAATVCAANIPMIVPMRTGPSLTVRSTLSEYGVYSAGTLRTCTNVSIGASSPTVVQVAFAVASGLTAGAAGQCLANNNNTAYLLFNAEL